MEEQTLYMNLTNQALAPLSRLTLSEMLKQGNIAWPYKAQTATQEADGEVLFWDIGASEMRMLRKIDFGLLNIIPKCHCVYSSFLDNDENALCAKDWERAVVTFSDLKTG